MTVRLMLSIAVAMVSYGTQAGFAQSPGSKNEIKNDVKNPLAELSASIRDLTRSASQAVVEVSVNGYSLPNNGSRDSDRVNRQHSIGSGVLVDDSGSVMTNAHVIEGAATVKVTVGGLDGDSGKIAAGEYDARIVGVDRDTDLALLHIDAPGLPKLEFGDSDKLSQGDLVFAMGSPLQFRNSLSMGVVSGTDRAVSEESQVLYIQTDAAINPGDSGGALIDTSGRLVGLNTFIVSQSGGSEGIGFAIPANMVRHVYEQLLRHGRVARGDIGVFVQNVTVPLMRGLSLSLPQSAPRGVVVGDVDPGGPGDLAGLKRRDVILRLDDRQVETARQFNEALAWRENGEKAKLTIQRGEERLALTATVRKLAPPPNPLALQGKPDASLISRLGLFCLEINQQVLDALPEIRKQYGLVVVARLPETQAESADLQVGDVIHSLNSLPIGTLDAFRSGINQLKRGDAVALQVERDGKLRYIAFDIE